MICIHYVRLCYISACSDDCKVCSAKDKCTTCQMGYALTDEFTCKGKKYICLSFTLLRPMLKRPIKLMLSMLKASHIEPCKDQELF